MLYIVGIVHMMEYVDVNFVTPTKLVPLNHGVLATFMFLSGFFLGKKKEMGGRFLIKRFIRLYLLYAIAATLMWIYGPYRYTTYLLSLTGLTNFILPQMQTLWFACILILFYAITPLMTCKEGVWKACIFFFILLLMTKIGYADERIIFYFPFYYIGLFLSRYNMYDVLNKGKIPLFLISLVAIFLLYNVAYNNSYLIADYLLSAFGVIAIVTFCIMCENVLLKSGAILTRHLSYASMCAYLFHRQIYKVLTFDSTPVSLSYAFLMVASLLLMSFFYSMGL